MGLFSCPQGGNIMPIDDREKEIQSMASATEEDRQKQVDLLIARAQDPDDPYDGHHGHDRTVGA
jgi:hypothetical protein